MEKYIFEYNENCGYFHQNFGDHKPETMGYKTVCECETYIWDPFNHWIHRRYEFHTEQNPSFETILKEWEEYLILRKEIKDYDKNH